jgi:hypothetical protein
MNGTFLTRISRLGIYLSTHPSQISRYIKTSLPSNISPIDLGLPWIAYGVNLHKFQLAAEKKK